MAILGINTIIELLYRNNRNQFLSWDLMVVIGIVYFVSTYIKTFTTG